MSEKPEARERPEEVEEYITEKGWITKSKGDNYCIQTCPFCENARYNFEIHKIKGLISCWACGKKGGFWDLKQHMGDWDGKRGKAKTRVAPIVQERTRPLAAPEGLTESVMKLHQKLWMRPNVLGYLKTRGFSEDTLVNFKIGAQKDGEEFWVVLPHLVGGIAMNAKFRSAEPKGRWKQQKGGAKVLFNHDALEGNEDIIIAEGEMKVMALWQMGFRNVVGLTSGVANFYPEWIDQLESKKKIYLCLDNDKDGQENAERLALRLGLNRTYNIVLPDAKDPDEYFFTVGHTAEDFDHLLKKAKLYDIKNLVNLDGALKRLRDQLLSKDVDNLGLMTPWPEVNRLTRGFRDGELIVLSAVPKMGKCHPKGTSILMADGSVRTVETLRTGDLLMGPDSRPRNVLSTARGTETMYWIEPKYGEPWGCNESHVLSLMCTKSKKYAKRWEIGKVYNMDVLEYLALPPTVRQKLKLWKAAVEFPEQRLQVDPYWVGLWLGDGSVGHAHISKPCEALEPYFKDFAHRMGLNYTRKDYVSKGIVKCPRHTFTGVRGKPNPLLNFVRRLVVAGEKRIPKEYLINDAVARRALLAGLLDSDGYAMPKGGIEWVTKFPGLLRDTLYLTRSLGFKGSWAEKSVNGTIYYRVFFYGDFQSLPLRRLNPRPLVRNHHVSKFNIKKLGPGEYYGFELDGDHLYLLGDFTVTHNTTLALNCADYLARVCNPRIPVLFYCMEMGPERLAQKETCLVLELEDELLTADDVTEARYLLRGVPMYLPERVRTADLDEILETIRAAYKRYGVRLVVFDNLHFLIRSDDNLREKLGVAVQQFKLLAEELRIPIMLVVHPRKMKGKDIMTSNDLRDTAAIHADADMVIILHRNRLTSNDDQDLANDNPLADEEEQDTQGILDPETKVIVDAARYAPGGKTTLYYEGAQSRFRSMTEEEKVHGRQESRRNKKP